MNYSSSSLPFGSFNPTLISTSTAHHSSAVFAYRLIDSFDGQPHQPEQQQARPRATGTLKTFEMIVKSLQNPIAVGASRYS
jgi:hypothetical protein